jgi:small subunit ribosomal protein S9
MTQQKTTYFFGVGRRKTSTARAKYYPNGKDLTILVNKVSLDTKFQEFYKQNIYNAVKNLGLTTGEIHLFTSGGGLTGQSEASCLAIAKALLKYDEGFRLLARMHGYLSTDIRQVAPKKAGKRKNRKVEQWSKR